MKYRVFKTMEREYYTNTRRTPDRNGNYVVAKSRMVTTWTLIMSDGRSIAGYSTRRQAVAAGENHSNSSTNHL